MSVQGSSRQSKAEVQAENNWLLQTCLSILEIFWYLWYPGDQPRDAESLGRSLYLWGAVYPHVEAKCNCIRFLPDELPSKTTIHTVAHHCDCDCCIVTPSPWTPHTILASHQQASSQHLNKKNDLNKMNFRN